MSKQKKSGMKRIGLLLTMVMVFAMVSGAATPAAAGEPVYAYSVGNISVDNGILSVIVNATYLRDRNFGNGNTHCQLYYHEYITDKPDTDKEKWGKDEWEAYIIQGINGWGPYDCGPIDLDKAQSVTGQQFSYNASANDKKTGYYIFAVTRTISIFGRELDIPLAISNFLIVEPLEVTSVTANGDNPASVDVDDGLNLHVDTTGGIGPYTYRWNCAETGYDVSGSSPDAAPSTPSMDGTYTYAVEVTDALGNSNAGSVPVSVTHDAVTPLLVHIIKNINDTYTARYGYDNPNGVTVDIPVDGGNNNYFDPAPEGRGQPTGFVSGQDTFDATFDTGDLTWTLDGTPVVASATANDDKTLSEVKLILKAGAGQIQYSYEDMDGSVVTGTTASLPQSILVPYGHNLTLEPMPDPMYVFDQWEGNVPAAKQQDDPLVLTVKNPKKIKVCFASPTEVWVDDNYTDAANDGGHDWGHDAFDNIDDGIRAVAEGGTVHIQNGNYNFRENGENPQHYILIDKPVTIDGQGDGTVLSNNDNPNDHGFFINARGVTISNLKFEDFCYGSNDGQGDGVAIYCGNPFVPHDYTYDCSELHVFGVTFNRVGNGVYVRGVYGKNDLTLDGADSWAGVDNAGTSEGILIEDCVFTNIGYKATYFEKGNGITIQSCSFDSVGLGYKTGSAIDVNLKAGDYGDVAIKNNTFTNCGSNKEDYAYKTSFAVTVKARGSGNDALGYCAYPATINSMTITGNVFTNSNTYDLALGEPGNEILFCNKADETDYDVTVSANDFTNPIINYCKENQMLLITYGDNTGIDARASRIESPGPIKFICTVSYDSQGGSAVADVTAIEDDTLSAPADPTKAANHFGGWYKEAGCVNKWDFAADTVTGNMTLYAKWNVVQHTVTFDSQGGSHVNRDTVNHRKTVDEPTSPTREGYVFGGWYKEKSCQNKWDFSSDVVRSDITLYAKWTMSPIQSLVRLFTGGGTNTAPSSTPEPTPEPSPETTPAPSSENDNQPPADTGGDDDTVTIDENDVPAGTASAKGTGFFSHWWSWMVLALGLLLLLLVLLLILSRRKKGQEQH